MKTVAVVFTQAPHGSSAGREGLDALLAISALCEQPGVFFIADGVLQLLKRQQPSRILARDYIATFGVLPFYDIEHRYLCAASLNERGLDTDQLILPVVLLDQETLRTKLTQYQQIFTF